ncbi:hypothetical protein BGZ94_002049 [Podila epigama]|nr:hypothetical protein BGZ94_002049 [Podila epigama]
MKFQPIILSLVVSCAYAVVVKRATPVTNVLTGVSNALENVQTVAFNPNGPPATKDNIGPLQKAVADLEKRIQDGINNAGAAAPITPADAASLVAPTEDFTKVIAEFYDRIKPFVPLVADLKQCQAAQKASAALTANVQTLTDAILRKIEDATAKASTKGYFDKVNETFAQIPRLYAVENCVDGDGGKSGHQIQ